MRKFEGKSKENRSKSVVWPRFRAPKGVAGPLFQFLQIFGIFLVSEIEAMDQEGLAVSDIGVSEAPEKPGVAWFFTVFSLFFMGLEGFSMSFPSFLNDFGTCQDMLKAFVHRAERFSTIQGATWKKQTQKLHSTDR